MEVWRRRGGRVGVIQGRQRCSDAASLGGIQGSVVVVFNVDSWTLYPLLLRRQRSNYSTRTVNLLTAHLPHPQTRPPDRLPNLPLRLRIRPLLRLPMFQPMYPPQVIRQIILPLKVRCKCVFALGNGTAQVLVRRELRVLRLLVTVEFAFCAEGLAARGEVALIAVVEARVVFSGWGLVWWEREGEKGWYVSCLCM